MKPHQRKFNEALYKLRKFKTIGALLAYDPTSSFLFRQGYRNGIKPSNLPNPQNVRATKAKRPECRFQKLRAFKLTHNLV